MADGLSGKVLIVTGGGSGMGRATALAAAGRGVKVAVADYKEETAADTVAAIKSSGGQAIAIKTDVSVAREVEAMVAATVKAFGRLDYAFNNAGIAQPGTNTVDCPEDLFDRIMAVNAKGVWLCMKYQIPEMLKHGGAIVNNASIGGIRANPFTPAYIASKHAVVALTQGAALEYGRQKIRVNCVCPGLIRTPLIAGFVNSLGLSPQGIEDLALPGRWADPEEVAEAVLWLYSDSSDLINGVALPLDGGRVAA